MSGTSGDAPDGIQKKVDESWKSSVENQKVNDEVPDEGADFPAPDLLGHLSTLAFQTLMALGEIRAKEGDQAAPDLRTAQYLIDTIQMLMDKTEASRTPQETQQAQDLLYQLRLKFVQKKQDLVV